MRLRALAFIPLALLLTVAFDLAAILSAARTPAGCEGGTVLVMGAAQYDGRPSPAFQRRLQRALERWESGCADRIVVSGGRREGDRFSEGTAGRNWLMNNGVDPAAVLAEEEAASSWQNVRYSLPLLEGPVVLVTDDLHAYRSLWVAAQHGLEARTDTVRGDGLRPAYLFRELAGLVGYQLGLAR